MSNKIFSFLKFIIGWPISLIAVIFIFKIIGQKSISIFPLFNQINIFNLMLGIIFLTIFFFLRGYLWHLIVREKTEINLFESLNLWAISEFKRYVPGSIWAFLGRTFSFEKKGIKKKDTAFFLFYEAQFFILGCIIVSLLSISKILDLFNVNNYSGIIFFTIYILFFLFFIIFIFNASLSKKNNIKIIKLVLSIFPKFNYIKNIKFLSLSSLAVFAFGLGSYFSSIALFNLDIRNFLIDSSFFTFSILIGYLSIITPMGLGVREGIIILGFSKILGIENAGILAIFTRFVLIISELFFIFLTIKLSSKNENMFKKFFSFTSKNKYIFFLGLGIIIYVLYFINTTFLRFDNFYTGKFDLGNMSQTAWNTVNGRIFEFTNPNGTEIVSRLAFHADFILILISPFYLLWESPKLLLLIQTLIISFGAIYIYLISNNILKNKNISLVFAFSYLINPLVNYVNLYDFHAVALAITFLLAAFFYILKNKFLLFLFFAILAGLTKEQVWLASGILSLYYFIKTYNSNFSSTRKKTIRFLSLIFSLISFFIFYVLLWIVIPNVSGSTHFALSYYSDFGNSPGKIIKNIIFDPIKIISVVFQEKQLEYLYNLFLPVGFLSIFSPLFLIFALPDLGINLLSNNKQLSDIYYQYTSTIIPFIFISSIFGFKILTKKINKNILIIYLLICSICAAYHIGPLPFSKNPNVDMYTKPLINRSEITYFLDSLSNEYSVAATNNLGAYLSNREKLYVIPNGIEQADFVIFLLNDPFAQPSLTSQKEMALSLQKNLDFELVKKTGDLVAFKRKNIAK